ncbi:MAG TPA: hypothetical protein VFO65_11260 [Acidimicrobiales bacterium]|nr:hypothetical protein [Acidimicrobiales bacterium]
MHEVDGVVLGQEGAERLHQGSARLDRHDVVVGDAAVVAVGAQDLAAGEELLWHAGPGRPRAGPGVDDDRPRLGVGPGPRERRPGHDGEAVAGR